MWIIKYDGKVFSSDNIDVIKSVIVELTRDKVDYSVEFGAAFNIPRWLHEVK